MRAQEWVNCNVPCPNYAYNMCASIDSRNGSTHPPRLLSRAVGGLADAPPARTLPGYLCTSCSTIDTNIQHFNQIKLRTRQPMRNGLPRYLHRSQCLALRACSERSLTRFGPLVPATIAPRRIRTALGRLRAYEGSICTLRQRDRLEDRISEL